MARRNIIATTLVAAALAMGFNGKEGGIKKAKEITRNWKEDQGKKDKLSRLEKAQLKRIRKAKLKAINSIKSKKGLL